MSGRIEKWTTSAGWPDSTARDWSPEAPNEVEKWEPLPCEVFWKAGISPLVYAGPGVEYATRLRSEPPLPPLDEEPQAATAPASARPSAATAAPRRTRSFVIEVVIGELLPFS